MTLSEIETILTDLRKRHTNLDKVLLTTILTASGWEDKTMKDALALFSQQEKRKELTVIKKVSESIQKESTLGVDSLQQKMTSSLVHDEQKPDTAISTFVETSTLVSTEKIVTTTAIEKSHVASSTREYVDLNKELVTTIEKVAVSPIVEPIVETPNTKEIEVEVTATKEEVVSIETKMVTQDNEPQSLIIQKEVDQPRKTSEHIPEDLPLLPFESSPHVWSFSKYKDVFHGEVMPKKEDIKEMQVEVKMEAPLSTPAPIPSYQAPLIQQIVPTKPKVIVFPVEEEEISLEKVPMTKNDESLVFLAGVMLLGIILILGYMYSNGRL